jgi:hypothetical protein
VIKKRADKLAPTPLNWESRSDDRPANEHYRLYSLYYYMIGDILPGKKVSKKVVMDTWIHGLDGIYGFNISARAYTDQNQEKRISTDWIQIRLRVVPKQNNQNLEEGGKFNRILISKSKQILKNHPVDLLPREMPELWLYTGIQDLTRFEFRQSRGYKIGFMKSYRNKQDQSSNVFISIRQFDSSRHAQVWYRWIEGNWWNNHRKADDMGIIVLNDMPRIFSKREKSISLMWKYGRTLFTINSTGETCEENAKFFLDLLDMVPPIAGN